MRKINWIIIHCSETDEGQNLSVFDIDRRHRKEGAVCIGFHFVITRDGKCHRARVLAAEGDHCLYHDRDSIGVCYVGGRRNGQVADTRTPQQKAALARCVKELLARFPDAKVVGHRDLYHRTRCPGFDVNAWARQLKLSPQNRYL